MIRLENLRFDDRIYRPSKDDGADFEQFVLEYFTLSEPELRTVRKLDRAPDGGIDLYVPGAPDGCLTECKFSSRDTKKTPRKIWAELRDKLWTKLKAAAEGEDDQADPYSAWLTYGPQLKYRLCYAAPTPSLARRKSFEKDVAAFFAKVAAEHPALAHLGSISVRIWWWDDFATAIATHPPLFFRWFGGLPTGVYECFTTDHNIGSFREYLRQGSLPYFSRSEFLTTEYTGSDPEAQWAKELAAGSSQPTMIISGAGGIGKTRLGLEICSLLESDDWWALRLEPTAKIEGLRALLQAFANGARIVFFIDYAERFPELNALADLLHTANIAEHRLRFVISCRTSMLPQVRDGLGDLFGAPIDAKDASESRHGPEYADWVVDKILAHFNLSPVAELKAVCSGLPVLAAFAAFLASRGGEAFDRQFGDLNGLRDFQAWAGRRIQSIEERTNDRERAREWLAELAIQLPIEKAEAESFENDISEGRTLSDLLKADRWIEPSGSEYVAAHDVFADALLGRYLFEVPGVESDRAGRLLKRALKQGRLKRALVALNRLAAHERFNQLNGPSIIASLVEIDRLSMLENFDSVINSRLLDDPSAIAFVSDHSESIEQLLNRNTRADFRISSLAEWASLPMNYGQIDNALLPRFRDIVAKVASRPGRSNIILRRAYTFEPARHSASVLARMKAETEYIATSFLIRAFLNAGGDPDEVEAVVMSWLSIHAMAPNASYVYSSWLLAKGNPELIRDRVIAWLEKYGNEFEARFVLSPLIQFAPMDAVVRNITREWISLFGHLPDAYLIYRPLISRALATDSDSESIFSWIRDNQSHPSARYFLDYIFSTDNVANNRPTILAQLDADNNSAYQCRLLQAWLSNGGGTEDVRPFIETWFRENPGCEGASYLISAWLSAGGDFETVNEHLLKTLVWDSDPDKNRPKVAAWFSSGASVEPVAKPFVAVLSLNPPPEEVQWLCERWLALGGAPETLRSFLVSWLPDNAAESGLWNLFARWMEKGGDWPAIRQFVRLWLAKNPDHIEIPQLMSRLGKHEQVRLDLHPDLRGLAARDSDSPASLALLFWALEEEAEQPAPRPLVSAGLRGFRAESSQAGRIFETLLRRGMPLSDLDQFLSPWLALHATEKGAAFLLELIANHGGTFERYCHTFRAWLTANPLRGRTNMVLRAWMNAGWPLGELEVFVGEWLAAHIENVHAGEVLKAWIVTGGNLDTIEQALAMWLPKGGPDAIEIRAALDRRREIDQTAPLGQA